MFNSEKTKIPVRNFTVIKDFGDDESFFRLATDGGEVQLTKLAFQKGVPLPDTLACRIKGFNGRKPLLGHDMPRYVSEFYADGFSRGEEFEFKVMSLPEDEKGFYRLVDDNGLIFKLREHKSALAIGQSVRCRFETLEPTFYSLRRSDTDIHLQMVNLRDIANVSGFRDIQPKDIRASLLCFPEMSQAVDELDHNRPSWVLTALRAARTALPAWFQEVLKTLPHEKIKAVLCGYKYVALYLLQGSGFLRNIKGQERISLQAEFTSQIEQADIYLRTLDIIDRHRQKRFINDLLDNLKESGYLYHPNEQFSIMMILFRLSPELVNTSLGNIFDTLMGWEPETWKAEPFRQAFVEQLEIFIRQTCIDIDRFMQPETGQDNETVEKVLTAIAIQNWLYRPSDRISIRQNMSLFYRYLSLLRTAKAQVLLHKSYLTLLGVQLPTDFTWSDIKEPTMMMTRAAVDPPATAKVPAGVRYFLTSEIEVELSPDGINISRIDDSADTVIPNGMLPWPGLNVSVTIERGLNRQKFKSLDGHDEFWNNIETALFLPSVSKGDQIVGSRKADIDDVVRIEIDRVIFNIYDPNRIEGFHCKVIDDHFDDKEGYLRPEDLVSYNLHGVSVGTFRYDDGSPMQFDAQVIEIDSNDRPVFSLLEATRQAVRDIANTDDRCYCVITRDNGRSYSAISERGYGLYINKFPDDPVPFRPGNVVLASITGYDNDAVQAVAEDGPIDGYDFRNARALHSLLLVIAAYRDEEEDIQLEEDETVTREEIREIVQILRYKAVSVHDNIIESFDYLSYARLLAIAIGDSNLADTIRAHKGILLQYQKYAKNKQVFIDEIERIASIAPDNILISRMSQRLRIVSALGKPDANQQLWHIINHNGDDTDRQLARAVLSYNFLCDSHADDSLASSIKDKIASMLNVEGEQRRLKYYGSESQYVEFKSSMVYPARKGRSGLSVADPDRQEHEILHIIAGFLNSTGGVLYIGVNDAHYECGLDDDFTFYRMDSSERNTKYRRSVKNIDNMCNYLQNLIDQSFNIGRNAGDYAKAFIDDESSKGVVYVKIDPCPHIVKLGGEIYVRHSGKTEPLTKKEEVDMFISDRERLYRQQIQANAAVNEEKTAECGTLVAAPETKTDNIAEHDINADQAANLHYSVKTASTRNNILHEWQDPERFVPASMYIRFVDDNNLVATLDEWSIDDTERLVLNVHDEEMDGYLLLVYEGEHAIKIPLSDVRQKALNNQVDHYGDRELIFASVVKHTDGLYTLHSNTKGTLYERVTPVERIASGNINTAPERLLDVECAGTEIIETIPAQKMSEFSQLLSTMMKRTQLGALAKGINSIRTTVADMKKSLETRLV